MKLIDLMSLSITEGLAQERVHHNPSVATLKALARNNRYHSVRFVITKDGDVVAGDSEHFTHHSMAPYMGAWEVRGYVQYMGDGEYAYRSMEVYSALNKDHPMFRIWERAGIENGNPDQSHLGEHLVMHSLMPRNSLNLFKHTDRTIDDQIQMEQLDPDLEGFVIYRDQKVASYLLVQEYQGNHWMLEAATAPEYRTQGLNSVLIDSAVKKHGRVIVDMQLTADSIKAIERYIKKTKYKVQRLNTLNGELHDYNPHDEEDQQIPMYNIQVPGVNRPSSAHAGDWVWVISMAKPRHPLLMGYVSTMENYQRPQTALTEAWSKKYKQSINCRNPKGFSQRAHCAGRKARQAHRKTSSKSVRENRMLHLLERMMHHLQQQGMSIYQAQESVCEQLDESLRDWFKQKWVRFGPDGKIRGACARGSDHEGKPKCLPQKKAWALGKKQRGKAARRKRREDPNPERAGAARMVATKESTHVTEKQDACYHKVKSRYKVWPSAYASGALVQCRKKGAANWGKTIQEDQETMTDYNNWIRYSPQSLQSDWQEYLHKQTSKWQHRAALIGARWPLFKNLDEFRDMLDHAAIVNIDSLTHTVENLTKNKSLASIERMVSSYSRPRDVDAIVHGLSQGVHMPLPIILQGNSGMWIMAGNTRQAVARVLGLVPRALLVDVRHLDPSSTS